MTMIDPHSAPANLALPVDADIDLDQTADQSGDLVIVPAQAGSTGALSSDPSGAQDLLDLPPWPDGNGSTAVHPDLPVRPITPFPVLPIRKRAVSGRYRSAAAGFQLELRVDVDGRRPLRKLSGDYYSVSGASTAYFGSWTVDAVTITTTDSEVRIVGTARTTWSTTFTVATVTIPRVIIFASPPAATIRWSTPSGAVGATYTCPHNASSFRTVQLEQDTEVGVTAFTSYDTGSLPSGGPARNLTVAAAYGEAGIQMLDTGGASAISTPANHIWNNASLHNVMQTRFSQWADRPQFSVWLLHAMRHELGVGLRGIMFDQQGLQRQGCASFYQAISAGSAANLREQLYVHTHELGHCFNLFHAFHKSYMTPPLPNRPGSLSWMNYPQRYEPGGGAPSGAAAFWSAFPFQFDDLELAHLRHGFRNQVIMGGNPFGSGAALDVGADFADSVSDTSGLRLSVSVPAASIELGLPVVVGIEVLAETGRRVHRRDLLHPKYGLVHVAIARPQGDLVVHRPPLEHCAEPEVIVAGRDEPQPVSAYIGYDASVGQVFEDPGTYRIRASYAAPDGSLILSDTVTLRVTSPGTGQQERVADLMLEDETGMVLTLLGSDSPSLATGTAALEEVIAAHADSPAAVFARLAVGTNAARPFASLGDDGSLQVRERDLDRADALLGSAVDASRGAAGLDTLTAVESLAYLAANHAAAGDDTAATRLRKDAVAFARSQDAPESVLAALRNP